MLQALEFLGDASSLSVEPVFNEGVFMYTADLAGTALDDLTINGSTNQENFLSYLAMGQTIVHPKQGDIFALKVDNSSKTKSSMYIVQLINSRIDPLPQAKLAGLSLSVGGVIAGFNEDIHSYSVNLPYGTKKVVVTPQLLSGSDYYVSYNSLTGSIIDLSKQDSVTVSVISQTTSTGAYNISFTIGASLPSELTGISVSGGALINGAGQVVGKDAVFDPSSEAYTIKIPRGTYESVAVSGIADNQDHVTYKQGSSSTSNVISGGINHLEGKKIEIIVNAENDPARRQGSSPKTYELTVSEVDKTPASLSAINVANGGTYKLFQWSDGQVSNTEGFADGCSSYTLSISRSASNITVTGASDADTTVSYSGSNATFTPDPAEGPLTIFASGDEFHTTTAYTVFFAYSDAYDALLSSISIHVGDLEAPSPANVNDPAQSGSSVPAKGNYIAKIPEGTTVFAVDTTAPSEYHVSCDPAFLSFPTAGQKITVTVDGGPAFNTTTYTVTVNIVPPKVPRLTSLYVGASSEQEVSFRTNVFSYRVALDPQSSSVDVPFLWSANGDTSLIHYSFNEGTTWIADNNKTGFDAADGSANSIRLKSNESASVQIRLSASDGVKRIYYIDVTCRGGASDNDLLSLTVKGNTISVPANAANAMEPTFEEIGSPFGTFDITATIPTTATVAYSGGVTGLGRTVSTALAPLEEKLITITVTAENGDTKAYTLKLVMTDAVSLLSFTAKFNSYTAPPPTRSGNTYTITVPTFTDYVEVSSAVGIGVSGTTPTVEIEALTAPWTVQTIGDTKSITITVIPEDEDITLQKVYTVTFVKADKKMAMGGTVGYVKTGSDGTATFDEYHKFTSTSAGQNLTFSSAVDIPNARALIVGGGGGGGRSGSGASSGGGGGGGFIDQTVALSGTTFPIVVGAGGAGGANANGSRGLNGGDSSAAGLTAYGGGGGGYHWNNAVGSAKDGASGGGAGGTVNGKAIYGNQGNHGAGVTGTAPSAAGGGGGAGGAGTQANGNNKGGVGGLGRQSDILGSNGTWYGGGGSAGAQSASYVVGTLPDGATAWNTVTPTANTGAGASGMVNSAALTDAIVGKTGASGIVIVRFPWAEQ